MLSVGERGSCRSEAARLGALLQPDGPHLSSLVAKMILVTYKSKVHPLRETRPRKSFVHPSPFRSGDEDLLAVPVEVSAPGELGVVGEQEGVQERRAAVVLPGEVIAAGRVGQRLGDVDLQVRGHGEHSGLEGHVVVRQAAKAFRGSRRSAEERSFHS